MAKRLSPQQPPVQDAVRTSKSNVSVAARPSPFASGPVAMVNQVRHGFGASGQLQGHAVPTQLFTPLVPPQHFSASMASTSSDTTLSLFVDNRPAYADFAYERAGQVAPPPAAAIDLFRQTAPSSSQQHQCSTDPFGSPTGSILPIARQQAQNEVLENATPLLPEDLFGPAFLSGQPSQNNAYEDLFGSPGNVSALTTMSSREPPVSSHQSSVSSSFSWPDISSPITNENMPYQHQQQQSSLRPFGQAPPPAAPFLGYGDNLRSPTLRAYAPSATTPELLMPDARSIASPATSTSPTTRMLPPSSLQITRQAPSPGRLVDDFMKIPVDERFAGTNDATPPTSKLLLVDIPDTIEGLEMLYAQKRWRSLTKKSLSMLQSPWNDVDMTLEIKSWWLAGLIKEGQYDNAASVLDQIGNLHEISGVNGATPFVPIRLFLLQALLSKCQGKTVNHEQQLFHLMMRLQSAVHKNETMSQLGVEANVAARWLRIAQFAIANHLVHQQKFMLALRICSQIDVQFLDDKEKVVVLSRVGRIRLQMSDLTAAKKLFDAVRYHISQVKADSEIDAGVSAEVVNELEARLLLNTGLLYFAENKLQDALGTFDSILYMQHTQVSSVLNSDAELFLDEDIVCSAVNNYAICALYCCDVKAAVAVLERMIRSNPQRFLNGVVVFNLSSLYDLQFDNATSKSRKEMMKKLAHLYDLEHVDPTAYRI